MRAHIYYDGTGCKERDTARFFESIASISLSEHSVAFPDCRLGHDSEKLFEALSKLHNGITDIDLAGNYMHLLDGPGWARGFSGVKENVKTLDLSFNYLVCKSAEALAESFSHLPKSIQLIKLNYNRIEDVNFNLDLSGKNRKLSAIMSSLHHGVKSVEVKETDIICPITWLTTTLMNQVTINQFDFGLIHPPFDITEALRARLILELETMNTPHAFLICGLLCEGRIGCVTQEKFENMAEEQINEVTLEVELDKAISFYQKAAGNEEIKLITDFLLWHIKTTTLEESIQQSLTGFELVPSKVLPTYNQFSNEQPQATLLEKCDKFPSNNNLKNEKATSQCKGFFSSSETTGEKNDNYTVPTASL